MVVCWKLVRGTYDIDIRISPSSLQRLSFFLLQNEEEAFLFMIQQKWSISDNGSRRNQPTSTSGKFLRDGEKTGFYTLKLSKHSKYAIEPEIFSSTWYMFPSGGRRTSSATAMRLTNTSSKFLNFEIQNIYIYILLRFCSIFKINRGFGRSAGTTRSERSRDTGHAPTHADAASISTYFRK